MSSHSSTVNEVQERVEALLERASSFPEKALSHLAPGSDGNEKAVNLSRNVSHALMATRVHVRNYVASLAVLEDGLRTLTLEHLELQEVCHRRKQNTLRNLGRYLGAVERTQEAVTQLLIPDPQGSEQRGSERNSCEIVTTIDVTTDDERQGREHDKAFEYPLSTDGSVGCRSVCSAPAAADLPPALQPHSNRLLRYMTMMGRMQNELADLLSSLSVTSAKEQDNAERNVSDAGDVVPLSVVQGNIRSYYSQLQLLQEQFSGLVVQQLHVQEAAETAVPQEASESQAQEPAAMEEVIPTLEFMRSALAQQIALGNQQNSQSRERMGLYLQNLEAVCSSLNELIETMNSEGGRSSPAPYLPRVVELQAGVEELVLLHDVVVERATARGQQVTPNARPESEPEPLVSRKQVERYLEALAVVQRELHEVVNMQRIRLASKVGLALSP